MVRSAAVTMDETRAGVGVELAATTHVLSGPLVNLGKSGGHTVQRLLGRPLQLVRGRVPAASMKSPSWYRRSSSGSAETPKRIWWPLRSWSFLRMRQRRVAQPLYSPRPILLNGDVAS